MRPLAEFPPEQLRRIDYLLTDIDDTITTDGLLPAASLAAMERLQAAGIRVIPITGRPAGWCDHIARMWPVTAVVGENGAFYFAYDRTTRKMRQVFVRNDEERARDRLRLAALQERILREVPGCALASDQPYRVADLAIDFCEDVAPLSAAAVERIVALFTEAGATAKISSIHVNGWYGTYDKLSMTERCLREVLDVDIDRENERFVFTGDSPNDAPMFAFFTHGVGVANVADFQLAAPPAWITSRRSAAGFGELVDALLTVRR